MPVGGIRFVIDNTAAKGWKGKYMINRIRSLQLKYSLSDEYIVEFIKQEIKRQAIQDLEGALKNASITKLEEMVNLLKEPINVTNVELSGSVSGSTGTSEDDVPSAVQPGRNRNKAKHKSKSP